MKRLYGSLTNRLAENVKSEAPVVSGGGTVLMYSDRTAVTIVRVLSAKRILVTEDTATRTDKRGMTENQEYEYKSNPNGAVREFSLRKDGRWKEKGGATVLLLGERDAYHDYSF